MERRWGSAPQVAFDASLEENNNAWVNRFADEPLDEGVYVRALFQIRGQPYIQVPCGDEPLSTEYTNALLEAGFELMPGHWLTFAVKGNDNSVFVNKEMLQLMFNNMPFYNEKGTIYNFAYGGTIAFEHSGEQVPYQDLRPGVTYDLVVHPNQSMVEENTKFINRLKSVYGCYGVIYAEIIKREWNAHMQYVVPDTTRAPSHTETIVWHKEKSGLPSVFFWGNLPNAQLANHSYSAYPDIGGYQRVALMPKFVVAGPLPQNVRIHEFNRYCDAIANHFKWDLHTNHAFRSNNRLVRYALGSWPEFDEIDEDNGFEDMQDALRLTTKLFPIALTLTTKPQSFEDFSDTDPLFWIHYMMAKNLSLYIKRLPDPRQIRFATRRSNKPWPFPFKEYYLQLCTFLGIGESFFDDFMSNNTIAFVDGVVDFSTLKIALRRYGLTAAQGTIVVKDLRSTTAMQLVAVNTIYWVMALQFPGVTIVRV